MNSSFEKTTPEDLIKTAEKRLEDLEKGADYTQLGELLALGAWKEANKETRKLILEVMGKDSWIRVRRSDIDNFPCDDLRTLDQLWVK